MSAAEELDWDYPDYAPIFAERAEALERIRKDPSVIPKLKEYYAENPWDFINDWGMTFDPRAMETGGVATMPFILWPRQREFLQWLYAMWERGERGLVEKTRDAGVTWLSIGFAVTMWLFVDGFTIGLGSRKEDLVDRRGDDKSLFEKARFFIDYVPDVFMPKGWSPRLHSANMRIRNPESGAAIIGEAGDQIGRGGRASMYLVDEAAFVENQRSVDAALSQTTNCQIDISTYNGNGNEFYVKSMKFDNTHRKFIFDWRDDPRKNQEWYDMQVEEQAEFVVAQEIDRDPNAAQEDVFIPAKYVEKLVDAHIKLGFHAEGARVTGFDPADTGDAKAVANVHGPVLIDCQQRKQGDIVQAMPWAFSLADEFRADAFTYDADGMGAPTMKLFTSKAKVNRMALIAYYGSGGIRDPDKPYNQVRREQAALRRGEASMLAEGDVKTNADTYGNFKSQSWSDFYMRCQMTYHAVIAAEEGRLVNIDPQHLVSFSSECKELFQLKAELSRPKRIFSSDGKIWVESKKEMKKRGVQSPNLAEAVVMAYSVDAGMIFEQNEEPMPEYEAYEQTMDGVM